MTSPIAARLDAELAKVRKRLRGHPAEHRDGVDDEVAVSVAGEARELDARTRASLLDRERLLVAAQGRLLAGRYGRCLSCGQPIPAARLEAIPWASECVRCQFATEQAEATESGA